MPLSPYFDPRAAAVYAGISAPALFDAPARDLVRMLQPVRGAILDVGTGTGAVAAWVAETDPPCRVVGVDASVEMLRLARQRGSHPLVAARLPHLPFRRGSFDVILAGFVISHIPDYAGALRGMASVCERGGRCGMTAWRSVPNIPAQVWAEIAARFIPQQDLENAFRDHVPWEGWFSEAANLERALTDAGFDAVRVETKTYLIRMAVDDFLASREASVQGAILRERVTSDQWNAFRSDAARAIRQRFEHQVEYQRDVHLAIGVTR